MRRTSGDKGARERWGSKVAGKVQISGSMLARNTLLNLIGQAVPLLVAVVAIPFVVRGLGTERFGLLSLAWVVLGYFTIFDLGLGRATTKYVAEALGKGEEDQVPHIIWTAVTVQAIMGFVGAIVLLGITDLLVGRVLNIPPELLGEARVTFHLLALSIPVVLISSSFSGVLEAAQRFDLINAVRDPLQHLIYCSSTGGTVSGTGLTWHCRLNSAGQVRNIGRFCFDRHSHYSTLEKVFRLIRVFFSSIFFWRMDNDHQSNRPYLQLS